jgi:hypothetical protein
VLDLPSGDKPVYITMSAEALVDIAASNAAAGTTFTRPSAISIACGMTRTGHVLE